MDVKRQDNQVFTGVFLIGLALLFITGYWWPGIMFVIGAAMIARSVSEGQQWTDNRNAVVVIAIGVIFALMDVTGSFFDNGLFLPLVLIVIGLYLLYGGSLRAKFGRSSRQDSDMKPKNDELV